MAIHQVWAEWSRWFWPLAINHLWQATLFALLVWAAMSLLRQSSPRARSAAWWLALAKFVLPVAWPAAAMDKLGLRFSRAEFLAADFLTSARILIETTEPTAEMNAPFTQHAAHHEFYCALTLVWLLGAIAVLANWQLRRWRLAGLLRAGSVEATGRAAELFAELQSRLGFKRRIPLVVCTHIAEPGVWGVWRPRVVLPPGLDERLSDDELAAVLAHELFHVRRRDNLLSSVRMVACGFIWFHPLVWLIDRRLTGECELMCDEKVIRSGGSAESYAAGLWKAVQHGLGWPVAGVSRVAGPNLKRRIELMLETNYLRRPALRQRALAGLTVASLVALTFAVSVLPRAEVRAQNQRSNGTVWENSSIQHQDDQGKKAKQKEDDQSVLPMSADLRPKILYKEKAQYTKEARDEKVEGIVVLNMVFGADAKITNIRVVRGLPAGLTEAAIEAAKKIRFEPAMKDGQPVSVRGDIEYSFRL